MTYSHYHHIYQMTHETTVLPASCVSSHQSKSDVIVIDATQRDECRAKVPSSEQSMALADGLNTTRLTPKKPPRALFSPKPGRLRNILSSGRSLTNKYQSENQSSFDGQYHREDDVTQGVSDDVSEETTNFRTSLSRKVEKPKRNQICKHSAARKIPAQSRPSVIVAIDFGTTHSGYVYSFSRDPNSVYGMRRIAEKDPRLASQKTLSSILLTPTGQFHSFGYNARSHYLSLCHLEIQQWMYFHNFTMNLYQNDELNKESLLTASNSVQFSALKVFTFGLKFFKSEVLNQLCEQSGNTLTDPHIRWVITVPSNRTATVKPFVRRAAFEAGMASSDCSEQLLIAEESVATSIYCRTLRVQNQVATKPSTYSRRIFQRASFISENSRATYVTLGSRYLIIDCGSGHVDITINELDYAGRVSELHWEQGGPYGSLAGIIRAPSVAVDLLPELDVTFTSAHLTGVDFQFESLLCDIFGAEFLEHYKRKYPFGWLHLMTDFESQKKMADPLKCSSLAISPSFSFINEFVKCRCEPETAVKLYGDTEIYWSQQGMLRFTLTAVRRLFQPIINQIKMAVGEVLNHPNTRDIRFVVMVGDLADSPIIQYELTQEFGKVVALVFPDDASLAVLKGALYYGLDPFVARRRRTQLAYGVGILDQFNPTLHPTFKRVRRNGLDWCSDIFDKYIDADEVFVPGYSISKNYTLSRPNQVSILLKVYSSVNPEARFITDPGVTRKGTLSLSLLVDRNGFHGANDKSARIIQTSMHFAENELKIVAVDTCTCQMVQTSIDYPVRLYS